MFIFPVQPRPRVTNDKSAFFLAAERRSVLSTCSLFFIHSRPGGRSGGFGVYVTGGIVNMERGRRAPKTYA